MRSRWLIVSAFIVAAGLVWAGESTSSNANVPAPAAVSAAAEPSPQAAPAGDPYLGMSPITTEAPQARKSCRYFDQDCANKEHGQHCGPAQGSCLCYVGSFYACVSGGSGGPIP